MECVKVLLDAKANPDRPGDKSSKMTPLSIAMVTGKHEAVEVLQTAFEARQRLSQREREAQERRQSTSVNPGRQKRLANSPGLSPGSLSFDCAHGASASTFGCAEELRGHRSRMLCEQKHTEAVRKHEEDADALHSAAFERGKELYEQASASSHTSHLGGQDVKSDY